MKASMTILIVVASVLLKAQATTPLYRVHSDHQQMGTQWQITAYVSDTVLAKTWMADAWRTLDTLNQQMSDYNVESELLRLSLKNAPKQWVPVSKTLYEVLERAQYFSRASKGTFDVTIGPLSVLWRRAFRRQTFPDQDKVLLAKKKVNYRWLKLKDGAVLLKKPEMRLDLGGIAKGYAVDHLFDLLQKKGLQSLLVEGGGDLRVGEAPPGKAAWEIQLLNGQLIPLKNQSIASSGATYKYLEYQGERYSHIIHPKTGYGQKGHKVKTVITKRCQDADALASILSLLPSSAVKRFKKRIDFDFELIVHE